MKNTLLQKLLFCTAITVFLAAINESFASGNIPNNVHTSTNSGTTGSVPISQLSNGQEPPQAGVSTNLLPHSNNAHPQTENYQIRVHNTTLRHIINRSYRLVNSGQHQVIADRRRQLYRQLFRLITTQHALTTRDRYLLTEFIILDGLGRLRTHQYARSRIRIRIRQLARTIWHNPRPLR